MLKINKEKLVIQFVHGGITYISKIKDSHIGPLGNHVETNINIINPNIINFSGIK